MTISVWQRRFEHPYEADVIVIGAGISGLGTAFWLTKLDPNLRVAIVERGRVGAGASGRNAGFVTSGSIAHFARQVERHGETLAWDQWQMCEENHALLREHFLAEGECGYTRGGSMTLSRNPDRFDELEAAAGMLAARGCSVSSLPAEDLPPPLAAYGSDVRAWHVENEGRLDPLALLERILRRSGATFFGNHAVLDISTTAAGVEIETDKMGLRAPRAVLATNAFAAELVPELAPRLAPVRGQCLQTAPVEARLPSTIYASDDWVYLRQHDDGSIVAGGHRMADEAGERGTEDRLNPTVHDAIDATLRGRFAQLVGDRLAVVRRWSGPMAYATRGRPMVGEIPQRPGAYFLGGYSGHGMGMGFSCAKRLAELMVNGQRPDVVDVIGP